MYTVELYAKVRRSVLIDGMSQREVALRYGLSRNTIAKMLKHSLPQGYQRKQPPVSPKLGPYTGIIDRILESDRQVLKKQRHTAQRIFERLRDEHDFPGGYTIVREYVARQQQRSQEVFLKLHHPPGHGQADFGETDILLNGVKTRIHYFCLSLPHSDSMFIKAYPSETTEAWLDGHVAAFTHFGMVPQSMLYDNSKRLVASIDRRTKARTLTQPFSRLQSHYLFDTRFGRPARGNDKGKVEGLVGYARRNFMVPMPRVASLDELNSKLIIAGHQRDHRVLRGHSQTIAVRLQLDLANSLDLPAVPFEACEEVSTKVSSQSLVRYRNNDYSVPTEYAYQTVRVKGYVDLIVIAVAATIIATHSRCYARAQFIYNPLHFLKLLESKPNALGQAAALKDWALPDEFESLRCRLEARLGNAGRREYIQVLRLMEDFGEEEVAVAVEESLRLCTISYDAVKHLVLAKHERRRPPILDMEAYPHLPKAAVSMTNTSHYLALLNQGGQYVC